MITLLPANRSWGQLASWVGGNGNFGAPANWSPAYPTAETSWVINGGTANDTGYNGWATFYGDGYIAFGEGSSGGLYYNMINGNFTIQHLFVGHSGSGTLHHYNGTFTVPQETHIGHEAGSYGLVVISGTGSSWKAGPGVFTVGYLGTGEVRIENGGYVYSGTGRLGVQAGSEGHAVVTGSGSEWNSRFLIVGATGKGTLTIENQGYVLINEHLYMGRSGTATGTVTVTGENSRLTILKTLEINGNGSRVISESGGQLYVGERVYGASASDDNVTIEVNNATFTTGISLYIGYIGQALMTVSAGGTAQAGYLQIGESEYGHGNIQVIGSNSYIRVVNSLITGVNGVGVLDVSEGAKVSALNASIAYESKGSGTLTVRGSGTEFETGLYLELGVRGVGRLEVLDGANVNIGTTLATNIHATGNGSALVDGEGSRVNVGTVFYLSYLGKGEMTISNGGTITIGEYLMANVIAGSEGTLNLAQGGTLEVGGGDGIRNGQGSAIINFSGGTLRVIGSDLTTSLPINLLKDSTIDTNGKNATLSGVLGGTGGLVKTGTGTLVLTASSNYTGNTYIRAGTVSLQGSSEIGKGDLVLENGAFDVSQLTLPVYHFDERTLKGQGVVNATGKFFSFGGTYESGDERATLTVLGNFSLKETALIKLSIDSALAGTFDRIVVDGTLAFSGTLQLTTNYIPTFGDVIQLFDAESYLNAFIAIEGIDLDSGYYWDTSNLYVNGTITVIPEPSSLLAFIIMGSGSMIYRRRAKSRERGFDSATPR